MLKIIKSIFSPSVHSNSCIYYVINQRFSRLPVSEIPMLDDFLNKSHHTFQETLQKDKILPENCKAKTFHIETYGCQMNENDSEIINSILTHAGYQYTTSLHSADIVLMNTCAIREGAENRIWGRLSELRGIKSPAKQPMIIGVLGCMAERLKEKLLEKAKIVDLIAGPDSYRDLPRLLMALQGHNVPSEDSDIFIGSSSKAIYEKLSSKAINVQLSIDETYADVRPIRFKNESPQAYVSIMRGCNNMCSFCIVPFTRGRERSRPMESILDEIKGLRDQGVKEITLLGQNVNSYHDKSEENLNIPYQNTPGFGETYKLRSGEGWRFESLLEKAADIATEVRFRFTSPHPKNFPKAVLEIIKNKPNICKYVHLPAQSGSSAVLTRMRRNYTREAYLGLVENIRQMIPEVSLSTDMICGFCGETEEEFQESLSLVDLVKYDQAFLFAYSMREKTHAHRNYKDDVPEDVKLTRLREMIDIFAKHQEALTRKEIGRLHLVLVEGGTKYAGQLRGRSDTNKRVLLKQGGIKDLDSKTDEEMNIKVGDYVLTYIEETTKKSLFGKALGKLSLKGFMELSGGKAYVDKDRSEEIMKTMMG